MNEMNPNLPPSLDAALTQFYTEAQPDSVFAARLEAQLRQRQIEMLGDQAKNRSSPFQIKSSPLCKRCGRVRYWQCLWQSWRYLR